jgi:hypothetical protein
MFLPENNCAVETQEQQKALETTAFKSFQACKRSSEITQKVYDL